MIVAAVVAAPVPAQALEWPDLWRNADQRGALRMNHEDYRGAAGTFDDPRWRAAALYRAGEYRRAAGIWSDMNDARAHYNRGNALARAGEIEAAMAAYQTVLAREPGHADARHNLALLQELNRDGEPSGANPREPQPQAGENRSGDDARDGNRQQSPGEAGKAGKSGTPDRSRDGARPADGTGDRERRTAAEAGSDPGGREQSGQRPSDRGEAVERQPTAGDNAEDDRPERQAAMEQWLRRIPDDPGGLLRRKFLYQYQRRGRTGDEVDEPW